MFLHNGNVVRVPELRHPSKVKTVILPPSGVDGVVYDETGIVPLCSPGWYTPCVHTRLF